MNSKTITIIGILAFILFILVASIAYDALLDSVDLSKERLADYQPPSSTQSNADAGQTAESNTVNTQDEAPPSDKTKAPDFSVVDANHNEIKLSDLFGKPIVLNFWASWCPPCRDEMPDFNKVYEEMGDEITFAMINMTDGQRETMEIGEKYIADGGYTFPVYYDITQEAAITYGISSIPTTIFIDEDGYIVTGARGMIDEKSLRLGIEITTSTSSDSETKTAEYRKISASEAKDKLDNNKDAVLLDVRTQNEFSRRRIPNAILLPDYDITAMAADMLPDKDALILVYCQSGARSERSAQELVRMGYTNVYDFGGISGWSYDTVSD